MTLTLPPQRAEAWRWTDLEALRAAAETPGVPRGIDPAGLFLDLAGPKLIIADGALDPRTETGMLTLETLSFDTEHPLGLATRGRTGLTATLGHASNGETIQIVHLATGGANHLPAELTLGDDVAASIVETFVGAGWTNRMTRFRLGRGARLMRSVRLLQDNGFLSLRDEADIGEGASYVATFLAGGGAGSRIDGALTLAGEGAYAEASGALLARGSQRHDTALVLRHAVPSGTSRQVWRSVADDSAACSVAARVEVARHAQRTDAEQSLKGIMLSRSATINAKPELEIFADDVKCAHGATVGELDRNALFYLASRGVAEAEAKALLTRAFVADAIERVGDEVVREAFYADVEKWFANTPLPLAGGELHALDHLSDFPAIPPGWAYLDTAATAPKPRAVIDAITRAYDTAYATVHRGVYQRSAEMTRAYEAARARIARFIGGATDEIVFTRGATEGINLVAQSWGSANLRPGDRILLSQLEHHSNIVPWQLLAERTGAEIDVAPLTPDHRIDLDAVEAMLTERHKLVALAHVSNVLGSVLDAQRAAALAHKVGAKLLLDGCQAVPRMPVDVSALDCDFYVFSGHKLYGPTGIGVLWGRAELLAAMPPWQGGGAMIDKVSFESTTYAPPPARFEAGTPHITGALGLHAAIDYVDGIGLECIAAHEAALVAATREALHGLNSIRLFGPEDSAGIVSFALEGVHPHDIGTILDESRVAIRAGHHCAQPLMAVLGVDATARASFGVYNGPQDVEALVAGLARVRKIFG